MHLFFNNQAGYTAIPVVDGWAGAEMRVFTLFDSSSRTNGLTDGWTDKGSYRVTCLQLKRKDGGRKKKTKRKKRQRKKKRKEIKKK